MSAKTTPKTRILVVDDEAPVRSMIGATLEHSGYEVALAESGSKAMEMIEESPFDLVLTDIVMQDGNGIALLERICLHHRELPWSWSALFTTSVLPSIPCAAVHSTTFSSPSSAST